MAAPFEDLNSHLLEKSHQLLRQAKSELASSSSSVDDAFEHLSLALSAAESLVPVPGYSIPWRLVTKIRLLMGSLFASAGAITRCRTECDAIFSLLKYVEDEESSDPDAKLDKARVFVRAALLQAHALRVAGQLDEAMTVLRTGYALDPMHAIILKEFKQNVLLARGLPAYRHRVTSPLVSALKSFERIDTIDGAPTAIKSLLLESGCMFVFEDVIARFESACRWNGAAFSQEDAWRSVWTVLRKLQPELLLAFTSITQDVGGSCTCYEFVSFVWGTCGLAPSPAKAAEVFQQCCVDLCQDTPFLLGAPVAVGELNMTRPPQMMGFIKFVEGVSRLCALYNVSEGEDANPGSTTVASPSNCIELGVRNQLVGKCVSAPVSTEPFPAEEAADEVPVIVEADQMSDWDVYWDDYIRLPSASAKVSTHSSSETRSCEPQIASMFSSLADDGEHINRLELAVLLSALSSCKPALLATLRETAGLREDVGDVTRRNVCFSMFERSVDRLIHLSFMSGAQIAQ